MAVQVVMVNCTHPMMSNGSSRQLSLRTTVRDTHDSISLEEVSMDNAIRYSVAFGRSEEGRRRSASACLSCSWRLVLLFVRSGQRDDGTR